MKESRAPRSSRRKDRARKNPRKAKSKARPSPTSSSQAPRSKPAQGACCSSPPPTPATARTPGQSSSGEASPRAARNWRSPRSTSDRWRANCSFTGRWPGSTPTWRESTRARCQTEPSSAKTAKAMWSTRSARTKARRKSSSSLSTHCPKLLTQRRASRRASCAIGPCR